jgi:hypothetical protein
MTETARPGDQFDMARVIRHTFGAIGHNAATFAVLALVLVGGPAIIGIIGADRLIIGGFNANGQPDFGAWMAMLRASAPLAGAAWLIGLIARAIFQGAVIFGTACPISTAVRPASARA